MIDCCLTIQYLCRLSSCMLEIECYRNILFTLSLASIVEYCLSKTYLVQTESQETNSDKYEDIGQTDEYGHDYADFVPHEHQSVHSGKTGGDYMDKPDKEEKKSKKKGKG